MLKEGMDVYRPTWCKLSALRAKAGKPALILRCVTGSKRIHRCSSSFPYFAIPLHSIAAAELQR